MRQKLNLYFIAVFVIGATGAMVLAYHDTVGRGQCGFCNAPVAQSGGR